MLLRFNIINDLYALYLHFSLQVNH